MTFDYIPFDRLMIGATLNLLSQAINRRVVAALHEQGFSDFRPAYHPVFQWCRPEGSRISDLAEMTGVTRSAMTQLIDVLVGLGYVERTADPDDGRATLIRRTERGWAVNRIAGEVVRQTQQEWSEALGPERFVEVGDALRKLTQLIYGSSLATQTNTPIE